VSARVLDLVPELTEPTDESVRSAVERSTVDNVGAVVSMLAYGIPSTAIEPSMGALELFQRLAEREDGLTTILRATCTPRRWPTGSAARRRCWDAASPSVAWSSRQRCSSIARATAVDCPHRTNGARAGTHDLSRAAHREAEVVLP